MFTRIQNPSLKRKCEIERGRIRARKEKGWGEQRERNEKWGKDIISLKNKQVIENEMLI